MRRRRPLTVAAALLLLPSPNLLCHGFAVTGRGCWGRCYRDDYPAPTTKVMPACSTVCRSSTSTTTSTEDESLEREMAVPSTASITTPLQPPDTLTLWKRRLITHEDPLSLHKLGAIAYSVSGAFILGVGGITFLTSFSNHHAEFAVVPAFLKGPSYTFVISNMVMFAASVRMSFLHRRFDLVARNAFLGVAVSSLFSGFLFLWTSPFSPAAFNNPLVNQSCFGVLVLLNVFFIMDTLLQVPKVLEGRRDKKAEKEIAMRQNDPAQTAMEEAAVMEAPQGSAFIADALAYVLPIAWGLVPVISTGYIASVLHDRPWFIDQCQYIDNVTGLNGLLSNIMYLQVLASLAASYGSLFVTLRDKKLITKKVEIPGISLFSVPAMLWTVYVTILFTSHLFDLHG